VIGEEDWAKPEFAADAGDEGGVANNYRGVPTATIAGIAWITVRGHRIVRLEINRRGIRRRADTRGFGLTENQWAKSTIKELVLFKRKLHIQLEGLTAEQLAELVGLDPSTPVGILLDKFDEEFVTEEIDSLVLKLRDQWEIESAQIANARTEEPVSAS
jgi:hypothetical protein